MLRLSLCAALLVATLIAPWKCAWIATNAASLLVAVRLPAQTDPSIADRCCRAHEATSPTANVLTLSGSTGHDAPEPTCPCRAAGCSPPAIALVGGAAKRVTESIADQSCSPSFQPIEFRDRPSGHTVRPGSRICTLDRHDILIRQHILRC
jgi:hypothetical protein